MMRIYLTILFITINNSYSYSQDDVWNFTNADSSSCYTLQIFQKDATVDSAILNPFLNKFGAIIIENGVYDFKIDGNKFFFHKVDSITSDRVYISKFNDTSSTFSFNLNNQIELITVSRHEGKVGWPREKMSAKNYHFNIILNDEFCEMAKMKVCVTNDCNTETISIYRYMTARSVGLPIFSYDGRWYMRDQSLVQEIK